MEQSVILKHEEWKVVLELLKQTLQGWEYVNRPATLLLDPIRNKINHQVNGDPFANAKAQ